MPTSQPQEQRLKAPTRFYGRDDRSVDSTAVRKNLQPSQVVPKVSRTKDSERAINSAVELSCEPNIGVSVIIDKRVLGEEKRKHIQRSDKGKRSKTRRETGRLVQESSSSHTEHKVSRKQNEHPSLQAKEGELREEIKAVEAGVKRVSVLSSDTSESETENQQKHQQKKRRKQSKNKLTLPKKVNRRQDAKVEFLIKKEPIQEEHFPSRDISSRAHGHFKVQQVQQGFPVKKRVSMARPLVQQYIVSSSDGEIKTAAKPALRPIIPATQTYSGRLNQPLGGGSKFAKAQQLRRDTELRPLIVDSSDEIEYMQEDDAKRYRDLRQKKKRVLKMLYKIEKQLEAMRETSGMMREEEHVMNYSRP